MQVPSTLWRIRQTALPGAVWCCCQTHHPGKGIDIPEKTFLYSSTDIFNILNDLLPRKSHALPSTHSDKSLADKFSTFFHQKVATIKAELDTVAAVLPPQDTGLPVIAPVPENCNHPIPHHLGWRFGQNHHESPTKSCMLDPMPTWLLKEPCVFQVVLPVLTVAVNNSLSTGVVPSSVKKAVILYSYWKSLDWTRTNFYTVDYYRPISNIPNFIGKVREKVVARQMIHHLNTHSLLDQHQSWTQHRTALFKVKSDINLALDRAQGAILVLLDLSPAFDTIDHTILPDRLEFHCGTTGCPKEWVKLYLTGRTQSVAMHRKHSLWTCIP